MKRLFGVICCGFFSNYLECSLDGITIPSLLPAALESSCWISRATRKKRDQGWCQILADKPHWFCSMSCIVGGLHEGSSENKMLLYLIYSERASEWLRMGKPVQRDGEHSPSLDCLAVSKKELGLETGLENIQCSCAIQLLCIFASMQIRQEVKMSEPQ